MTLDHIIYAGPDLDEAVARVEELLGVEAVPGGSHPGVGTRNALVSFGNRAYLEIIGPDPEQPEPPQPRWFGIDDLEEPRLATWCARASDLDGVLERARALGLELGPLSEGGRIRPDGAELRWRVTNPTADRAGGVVPFFIDWLGSPHPGRGAGQGCRVRGLTARHPRAEAVDAWLDALGLRVEVEPGDEPALRATLETPSGLVELA